ncbi:WD40 repeat-containing protein [Tanacetum coccineum]
MDTTTASSILDDLNTLSSASLPSQIHQNDRNVFHLLARREIAPRNTKCLPKRHWAEGCNRKHPSSSKRESERVRNTRRELLSWVEAESLRCLTAKYCPLVPSPRSTIAAAFSADGKILASTHGDHTVKIINCQTGKCEKVLSGHRRTPWVVRYDLSVASLLGSTHCIQKYLRVEAWIMKFDYGMPIPQNA